MPKHVTPAVFGIALICFALPWYGTRIGDRTIGGATGLQMVTGKAVSEKGLFGFETRRTVRREPMAVVALLAVLGGIAAGFAKGRRGTTGAVAAGAVAAAALAALRVSRGGDDGGLASGTFMAGFYLALLLSAAPAALNARTLYAARNPRLVDVPPAAGKIPRGNGGAADGPLDRFCVACGARLREDAGFCGRCGKKLEE